MSDKVVPVAVNDIVVFKDRSKDGFTPIPGSWEYMKNQKFRVIEVGKCKFYTEYDETCQRCPHKWIKIDPKSLSGKVFQQAEGLQLCASSLYFSFEQEPDIQNIIIQTEGKQKRIVFNKSERKIFDREYNTLKEVEDIIL